MKIKISYFYHVRNLKQYQIPVSTAVWDLNGFMIILITISIYSLIREVLLTELDLLRLSLIILYITCAEVRISALMYVREFVIS